MKYQLIKIYPGSPKLEYISIPKTEENKKTNNHYYSESWFDPSLFPEFWQKVEEVDYEILTVTPSDKNLNNTNKEAVITFKMCNKDLEFWNIHSVKRLSDGEVFTIGDEITLYDEVSRKFLYKITEFTKMADTIQVIAKAEGRVIFYRLKSVEKRPNKTPLFTTEDGVEIFEGDSFSWTCIHPEGWNIHSEIGNPYESFSSNAKTFSTKEKAEEYILMNKPCLSIKEITEIFGQIHIYKEPVILNILIATLQELVKSKL